MAPFRFTLEKVLTVREMETLQAHEVLVAAQSRAVEASLMMDEARRARQAFAARLEERRERGMAAWEWAASSRQHESLSRAESAAADLVQRAQEGVAAARVQLEGALAREEALNKLRERQWEEFRSTELLAEQAINDELAQIMRLRKGVG